MTPAEMHLRELAKANQEIPSIIPNDFPANDIAKLIRLYSEQPFPVDKLAYTQIFEALVKVLNEGLKNRYSHYIVFGLLVALRKQERLPLKKG